MKAPSIRGEKGAGKEERGRLTNLIRQMQGREIMITEKYCLQQDQTVKNEDQKEDIFIIYLIYSEQS